MLLKISYWKYQIRFLVLLLFSVRLFTLHLLNLPNPSLDLSVLLPFGSSHHPHYIYTSKHNKDSPSPQVQLSQPDSHSEA